MDPAIVSKISRIRGWVLIVLGSLLSVGIAVIAAILASVIAQGDQTGASHWTGSHDFTVHVFELFAAVFVFGVVALGGGIFQVRRGRASWPAVILMLVLLGAMFYLGQQITGAPQ